MPKRLIGLLVAVALISIVGGIAFAGVGSDRVARDAPSAANFRLRSSALPGRLVIVTTGPRRARDIAIVDPRRRTLRRITHDPRVQESFPEWSPDGSRIAFARGPADLNDYAGSIYVVGSTGRGGHAIGHGWSPRWHPSGRILAFDTFRGVEIRWVSSPQRGAVAIRRAEEPSWSRDGTRLSFIRYQIRYVEGHVPIIASSSLVVVRRNGTNERRVARTRDCEPAYHAPDWSPDGRTIAVVAEAADREECPGSAPPQISLIDVVTGRARSLPVETGQLSEVRWSRDGRWLAYASEHSGVGVLRPNGTDHRRFPRSSGRFIRWSPDNRWLAWIAERRIVIASVAGPATVAIPASVRPYVDDGVGMDWGRR